MNSLDSEDSCVYAIYQYMCANKLHPRLGSVVEFSYVAKTAVVSVAETSGVALRPPRCT